MAIEALLILFIILREPLWKIVLFSVNIVATTTIFLYEFFVFDKVRNTKARLTALSKDGTIEDFLLEDDRGGIDASLTLKEKLEACERGIIYEKDGIVYMR